MDNPKSDNRRKTGFLKFLAGCEYALTGLSYAFRTQCNIRVHIGIATAAIVAAALLRMSAVEFAIILLTIVVVLAAELFNTAIETSIDLVSPDYHSLAKTTKDVSAAAVLVCATGAIIIGALLFGPALWRLVSPPH